MKCDRCSSTDHVGIEQPILEKNRGQIVGRRTRVEALSRRLSGRRGHASDRCGGFPGAHANAPSQDNSVGFPKMRSEL
jgi:hypothetical protein